MRSARASKTAAGACGVAAAQCSSMPWMVCAGLCSAGVAVGEALKVCSNISRSGALMNPRRSIGVSGWATISASSAYGRIGSFRNAGPTSYRRDKVAHFVRTVRACNACTGSPRKCEA